MNEHEQLDGVLFELARQGVITIYDKIDAEMTLRVRDRLMVAQAHGVKELEVRIQTGGGNSFAGLTIHDMIRAAPVDRRIGLVMGEGHSAGAIILQACDHRVAMRHARFLIHEVILGDDLPLYVLRSKKEMKKLLDPVEEVQRTLEKLMVKRTGRTLSEVRKECERAVQMSAEEALEFGLIDAIRD